MRRRSGDACGRDVSDEVIRAARSLDAPAAQRCPVFIFQWALRHHVVRISLVLLFHPFSFSKPAIISSGRLRDRNRCGDAAIDARSLPEIVNIPTARLSSRSRSWPAETRALPFAIDRVVTIYVCQQSYDDGRSLKPLARRAFDVKWNYLILFGGDVDGERDLCIRQI